MKLKCTSNVGRTVLRGVAIFLAMTVILPMIPCVSFAEGFARDVGGKLYKFGDKGGYAISKTDKFTEITPGAGDTYGTFRVYGDYSVVGERNGVPAYQVREEFLQLFYNHADILLNADKDHDHICADEGKKVDGQSIGEEIKKGVILVQTSKDRVNWVNTEVIANAFAKEPIRTNAIYTAKDVELINGCYYRVIVAYKLEKRVRNSNFLFIDTDKFEYKHIAEVYEFYAVAAGVNQEVSGNPFYLGEAQRVKESDGYRGAEAITNGDVHSGTYNGRKKNVGQFYVDGYTREQKDTDGTSVFLKNVGDKVTLWFNLEANINALWGDENLKITPDSKNSDDGLGTGEMNLGRGALFIRYTGRNNKQTDAVPYTNYLEANASVGADTKVELCEEGDYEVALNYKITKTTENFLGLKKEEDSYYRIFFKFKVRNGNCMAYPFDVKTGAELSNSSMTENGFRLDLARSQYLEVTIQRDVLAAGADGLIEDTRFNGPAKDGAEYTEDGIYTIKVRNVYTGEITTKKIYVGVNPVMKAHMATGLSISEINALVAQGATIGEDGSIRLVTNQQPDASNPDTPGNTPDDPADVPKQDPVGNWLIPVAAGSGLLLVVVIGLVIWKKKKAAAQTQGGAGR